MATSPEKIKFWQDHVAAFEKSDLTQIAYTKSVDIPYHQFKYWRYRFLNDADISMRKTESKPVFKELRISQDAPQPAHSLHLKLHNGNSLAFSPSVPNDKLKFIIDALGSL